VSDENLNQAATAVPEQESTTAPESVEIESSQEAETPEPRTFTQEELDKIVAERIAKAERKLRREQAQAAPEPTIALDDPPRPEHFESAVDYAEALAEHKAAVILAQREAHHRRTTIESSYAEREEEARSKYDDFEAVAYNPDLPITDEMAEVIKDSALGPDVAYHLGKNPAEARRIARLSPLAQARELGKIEATLASNPPVKKVSSAPDPIKPVGSRSSNPTYDPTDPRSVKTLSDGDWIKARNKQVAKKYAQ
jgi:hypothetical protein